MFITVYECPGCRTHYQQPRKGGAPALTAVSCAMPYRVSIVCEDVYDFETDEQPPEGEYRTLCLACATAVRAAIDDCLKRLG